MTQKTIYIAGPMSGLPGYNHPAFYAAEERLEKSHPDWRIINPANNNIGNHDGMTERDIWRAYMRISVKQIAESDVILHARRMRGLFELRELKTRNN